MTFADVHGRGDTLLVRFGISDVEIPEPLVGFVRIPIRGPA